MWRCKKSLVLLGVFLLWMLTSFLCHKLAKMAMNVYVRDLTSTSAEDLAFSADTMLVPFLVTLCQLLCCWAVVNVTWEPSLSPLLLFSHVLATLATNTSMALTFASSTMAIKMLEPVTSAVLQRVTLKVSMGWQSVVSVVVVVAGAVLYVGSPWQSGEFLLLLLPAIILAFLSNVALGVRNVSMKLLENDNHHQRGYHFRNLTSSISFSVILLLNLLVVHSVETALLLPPKSTQFLILALGSGVFHVAYSCVSMKMVLRHMSVISHAIANIFKRLLVVLLLYVTGQRLASFWNWAGLFVSVTGLCLYQRHKRSSSSASAAVTLEKATRQGTVTPSVALVTTRPLRILLFLLTLLYVICLTSVWVSTANPGLRLPLSWNKLHMQRMTQAHNSLTSDLDLHHHINSPKNSFSAGPFDFLLHNGTNWPNLTDTLPVVLDTSTNELFSPLLTMDRQLSKNARETQDYARRLYLGWEKWTDGQVLMNQDLGFQPTRKALEKVADFLQRKPSAIPLDTDGLSPYLTSTRAVIAESHRITLSLFRDLLAGKKYAILVGLADFENKGDPAISVGEVVLLEKLGIKLIFYISMKYCSDWYMSHSLTIAQRYPVHEVVIVMNGGGNLIGYPSENNCRKKAFRHFSSYQQVIFSESIFMRASKSYMDVSVKMYCCNSNLTILLRDRQSLHIARRLFNNGTRLILAPDMAFQNGPVTRYVSPYYDVMWLDRSDGERPEHDAPNQLPPNITLSRGDWMRMRSLKGSRSFHTSVNILLHGYDILQRGRVVITERLHGHILCVLLDIPHVLLDNDDLKLSSYYNTWTRGISNCLLTNRASHAVQLALDLLKEYNHTLPRPLHAAHIDEHQWVKGAHK